MDLLCHCLSNDRLQVWDGSITQLLESGELLEQQGSFNFSNSWDLLHSSKEVGLRQQSPFLSEERVLIRLLGLLLNLNQKLKQKHMSALWRHLIFASV